MAKAIIKQLGFCNEKLMAVETYKNIGFDAIPFFPYEQNGASKFIDHDFNIYRSKTF